MADANSEECSQFGPYKFAEVVLDTRYLQDVEGVGKVLETGKQNGVVFKLQKGEFKAYGSWKDLGKLHERFIQKGSGTSRTVLTIGDINHEAETIIHNLIDGNEWGDTECSGSLHKKKCNIAMTCWVIGKYFDRVEEIKKSITAKFKSLADDGYRLSLKGPGDKVEMCFKGIFKLCEDETKKLDGIKFALDRDLGEPIMLEVLEDLEQFLPVMSLVNGTLLFLVLPKENVESCREFLESIIPKVELYKERVSTKVKETIVSFCDSVVNNDTQAELVVIEDNKDDSRSKSKETNNGDKISGLSNQRLQGDPHVIDYIINICKHELENLEEKYNVSIDDSQVDGGILTIIANDEESSKNIGEAYDAIADKIQKYHFDLVTKELDIKNVTKEKFDLTREKINKLAKKFKVRAKIDKDNLTVRFIAVENMDDFLTQVRSLIDPESVKQRRTRILVPEDGSQAVSTENDEQAIAHLPAGSINQKPIPLDLTHAASGVNIHACVTDITKLNVDAIVNAANEYLDHGGGVAHAISKAGGYWFNKECKDHIYMRGPVKVGQNCVTNGGSLPCKKVIHAVGPRWNKRYDKQCFSELRETFANILKIANTLKFASIAIPSISSGIFGMPKHHVADIMVTLVIDTLNQLGLSSLTHIHLVDIDYEMIYRIQAQLNQLVLNGDLNKIEMQNGNDENLSVAASEVKPKRERQLVGKPDNENPVFQSRYTKKRSDGHVAKAETGDDDKDEEPEDCCICLCPITNPKTLKCNHTFCTKCIDKSLDLKPVCPKCGEIFGVLTGDQPHGTMEVNKYYTQHLPGYNDCGTLTINYNIPSGTQTDQHPNPGKRYYGCSRTAHLPDNEEGRKVADLLRKAFDAKLIFTVGRSVTSGQEDVVTWNDIHHKTNIHGGAHGFGYPDPGYLKRVQEELAAKGIK